MSEKKRGSAKLKPLSGSLSMLRNLSEHVRAAQIMGLKPQINNSLQSGIFGIARAIAEDPASKTFGTTNVADELRNKAYRDFLNWLPALIEAQKLLTDEERDRLLTSAKSGKPWGFPGNSAWETSNANVIDMLIGLESRRQEAERQYGPMRETFRRMEFMPNLGFGMKNLQR